jgi:hypothetical protein
MTMYNEYYRRKIMIEACVHDLIQEKGMSSAMTWLVDTLATVTQEQSRHKRVIRELKRMVKWWKDRTTKKEQADE